MAAASTQQLPQNLPQPLSVHLPPQPAYTSQATLTPPDSDSSSSPRSVNNALPPHLQLQTKQLRSPRSPMYVPAVLIPTEKPIRQSPPKRGVADVTTDLNEEIQDPTDTSSIRRIVTEEWNEARLEDVTGPPSRNHWKPDPSSPTCDSPTCSRPFTLFIRRHHCRRCGSIFCAPHSTRIVPLDQHARFHSRAQAFRACDDCWRDYKVWEAKRKVKMAAGTSGGDGEEAEGISQSVPATPVLVQQPKKGLISSIAQSVPRDWNWSTF